MGDKCIHLYLYKINYRLNKRQWYAAKYGGKKPTGQGFILLKL